MERARRRAAALCLGLFAAAGAALAEGIDPAAHVALVVNEAAPGSLELAQAYARRRRVPLERIVRLRTVTTEAISRAVFAEQVEAPLRAWLEQHPQVFVLVPTRGVPLKVEEELADAPPGEDAFARHVSTVDAAAVDRELELLRQPPGPLAGWSESPAWQLERPLAPADARLIVMRLDGPTPEVARGLIDLARHGELYGVEGTHLLDTRGLPAQDGYGAYDAELRAVGPVFDKAGLALRKDDQEPVLDLSSLGRPGHLWAWYGGQLQAARPFRFAPGAVACHVHSFSADTVRDPHKNWVGPLLAHGATVVVGTVYEPLTAGFPTAPRFWSLFLAGATAGDALTRANRFASWMAVFVGDPLYAPYDPALRPRQAANRALALEGPFRLARLLDQEDLVAAGKLAGELAALDVPLEAAPDPRPLVREARGRIALGRKGKGTVQALREACARAEEALQRGEAVPAREEAEAALRLSGTSFEANLLLARALLALGEGKPALAAAALARQVDAEDPGAQAVEAAGLLAAGKPADALAAAERVGDAGLAGRALAALERWDQALAALEPLADPDPAAALALARALRARERHQDAVRVLSQTLERRLPTTPAEVPAWEALLEPWVDALARARDPRFVAAQTTARAAQRLKPPPRKQAERAAAEARALLLRGGAELPAPPSAESPGPARVRLQSRRLEPARLLLLGPTAFAWERPAARGGATPTHELALPAGVYRLVLVEGQGEAARVRQGTLRAALDRVHGLGLDAGDAWFIP